MYIASVARFDYDAAISEGPKIIFRAQPGKLSNCDYRLDSTADTLG